MRKESFEIIPLSEEQWKGYILPIGYTTKHYYDVSVNRTGDGFCMQMKLKEFGQPVTHTPEEYDFPDRLYADDYQNANAWGIVEKGELIAAVEAAPEKWSNRLRVTDLWVHPEYQKRGIGHALIELVKEHAEREGRRAVMLETQSCNVNAIGFYLHEGFTLIGFDSCCYRNDDLERKEVRIELGWFPDIL